MRFLIEKELGSSDKLLKPDLKSKSGRELLAFYLQSKFKQLISYDKKCDYPLIKYISHNFSIKFAKKLIENPNKKILIGISGLSASGKSTICEAIHQVIHKIPMSVSILSTDNYFKDISALIAQHGSFDNLRDNGYDIDSPQSLQLDILYRDLTNLAQGIDILAPKYLPNGTGVSLPNSTPVQSKNIIVVEGTATIYDEIRDLFDIGIYIEADEEIRKERFFSRAEIERNQDLENAKKHFEYLRDAAEKYILPHVDKADIILDGNANLEYFTQILEYLYAITNNFQ